MCYNNRDCDDSDTLFWGEKFSVPRHDVYETLIKNVFATRRNSRYIRTHVTRKIPLGKSWRMKRETTKYRERENTGKTA